jgi:RNA polymerase sigma-70 factor (ECF subfamily)
LSSGTPTVLLQSWRGGDRAALDQLLPLVYDELARIASGALGAERRDHTLQTRALVHEAYLRLIDADVSVNDRAHFFALAARTMRRVLADHARSRHREKRGGERVRVPLTDLAVTVPEASIDFLDLDEAIERLEAQDPRRARVVELHFFGGMNYEETAEAMGISAATVDRDLRLAKAWLRRELKVDAV